MFSLCCSVCDYVCVEGNDMKNHVSAGHAGEAAALISLSVLSGAFPFSRTISLLPVCVRSLFLCLSFSQSHSVYLLVHHLTLSLPLYLAVSLSVSRSPSSTILLSPSPCISLSLSIGLSLFPSTILLSPTLSLYLAVSPSASHSHSSSITPSPPLCTVSISRPSEGFCSPTSVLFN